MANLSKIKVQEDLKKAIRDVVDNIGGLEKFVKPGEIVFLKPNFNTADPFPASSSLDFLEAVIGLIYEIKGVKVILGDSCTLTQKTENVMKAKKVFELKEKYPDLEIMNLDKFCWVKKEIPGGKFLKSVSVPEILDKVDRLILLPCCKTHFIAEFTGALKLSVGFMKTSERLALHVRNTQEKIAELNRIIKPDLIIMDARKCFITNGPSEGEVREPNLILASTDRVAIDVEGVSVIQSFAGNSLAGKDPYSIKQIGLADKILIS